MNSASSLSPLPDSFADVAELEYFMCQPSQALVDDLSEVSGDILVLGVGGKMGPTLARLAKAAAPQKTVIGVARFSEPSLADDLQAHGIETIKADLLRRDEIYALPDAENIIFMAGRKFGSQGSEELTWAMNSLVPAMVAERYNVSRIVAFSTGCVYPFVATTSQGATEEVMPDPPGEYAQSCVGRERMFEYFSKRDRIPGSLIRLNYAIDMRYGVLFDIANKVWNNVPVDVTMGHANVIWQGDANSHALRMLRHCSSPMKPINISGPETLSVRWAANRFGQLLGKDVEIVGTEAEACWLVNTAKATRLLGYPSVPLEQMMLWVSDWIRRDMPNLDKPTHFEARNGQY